ncbi:GNAT family N-acetyltransferase [Maribacter halichondriae]|uniref:GNAT family N-acetyltransferase n=1 Tax=Maribacter halichondriae TaxID=2980554 RepID=UPI002358ADB6|nr:GNAT family N-acetyltransferase [Maribacter sp. Hal144]
MQKNITIKPLQEALFGTYMEVGRQAYEQHYLHLWQCKDPDYYIKHSFTRAVLLDDMKDTDSMQYMVYADEVPAGILKLRKVATPAPLNENEALLLDKIYLLKEFSGQGIGSFIIDFVLDFAKKSNKKVVWLETMKKGQARFFYEKNGFEIFSEKTLGFPGLIDSERGMFIMKQEV